MDLTWKRGKKPTTYGGTGGVERTVEHTTYTATLSSGEVWTITTIDGTFFIDQEGVEDIGRNREWSDKLSVAKRAVQRRENVQVRQAALAAITEARQQPVSVDSLDAENAAFQSLREVAGDAEAHRLADALPARVTA